MNQFIRVRRVAAVGFAGALLFGFAAVACDRLRRAEPVDDKPTRNPCEDFAARMCGQTANEFSTTCVDIKTTLDLFTPDTCQLALEHVDRSLKALAGRDLSCDALQAKICADTSPTTKACEKIKKYTKKFPPRTCKEMLGRYPAVLADVKQGLKIQ